MIGDRIRALREARSWTQAHLADAAEVSLRTIQRLESVHSCSPETLLALAAALDVDVRSLTGGRPLPTRRWSWPSPRAAAVWGGALALPAVAFVTVNLLKYGAGVATPYDALAETGARLGLVRAFEWVSPVLLLGGPVAAVAINLLALVRPRIDWDGSSGALTAVDFRLNAGSVAVTLAAASAFAILCGYLISENLATIARAL